MPLRREQMSPEDYAPSQVAGALCVREVPMLATDATPRDNLAAKLTALVYLAKRCVPKVGTVEVPTEWDRCHRRIDAGLDQLEDLTP